MGLASEVENDTVAHKGGIRLLGDALILPIHQCPPLSRLIRTGFREEIHVYTVGITSFKEVKNTLFQLYEQHQFVLLPFQGQRSFIQLHMCILVHLDYKMSKYFAYLI